MAPDAPTPFLGLPWYETSAAAVGKESVAYLVRQLLLDGTEWAVVGS